MRLSEADRAAIERLRYNPSLAPAFDIVKSCLIWRDESPEGVSPDGRRFVSLLWIYRSFMHQGIPEHSWPVDPRIYREAWEYAVQEQVKWPGFMRQVLSASDRAYLEKKLSESDEV